MSRSPHMPDSQVQAGEISPALEPGPVMPPSNEELNRRRQSLGDNIAALRAKMKVREATEMWFH